jgi:flagellar biosynthetic protein FliR
MLTELLNVSPEWSANFLLVFARLSAALVPVPLFGARSVPPQTKIGLGLLLSLIVLPLNARPAAAPTELLSFFAIVGSEVLVGLAIGIAVMLVFQAIEMGAGLVGLQIGFSFAEVVDPLTGARSGVMELFYRIVATLVFFTVNGHYLVIGALVHTFEVVPAGDADLTLIAGERVVPFFAALFVVGLRVALPVTAALILTDLALGIVGRAVPQMNVLIVGLPLKVGVGLFVLAVSTPFLVAFTGSFFTSTLLEVNGFLRPLG